MAEVPKRLSAMWTETPGGGSVLLESSPTLYKLNETAFEVWKTIDGKRTVDEICALMSETYSTVPGETLGKDVRELLEHMCRAGLLDLAQQES